MQNINEIEDLIKLISKLPGLGPKSANLENITSKLEEAKGKRTMFEGVAVVTLEKGLIKTYTEVANSALGLQRIGFEPNRLARFIKKQGEELAARDESKGHL